jgi:hypothetical protein
MGPPDKPGDDMFEAIAIVILTKVRTQGIAERQWVPDQVPDDDFEG